MFAWLTGNTDFVKRLRTLILSDLDSWDFTNRDTVQNTKANVTISFSSSFNFNIWLNSNAISGLTSEEQNQIMKICKQAAKLKTLREIGRTSETPLIKENLQLKERLAKYEQKQKKNKFSFISETKI